MLRKHASLIIAMSLIVLVATACIVRTSRPPARRGQPVYVEKHKPQKHKPQKHKHKKHR
jgi:ABC-type nickel/cobalt efflux system permease component RcnA